MGEPPKVCHGRLPAADARYWPVSQDGTPTDDIMQGYYTSCGVFEAPPDCVTPQFKNIGQCGKPFSAGCPNSSVPNCGASERNVCQRDWDKVMNNSAVKLACCMGRQQDPDKNCAPDYCPEGTPVCDAFMRNWCSQPANRTAPECGCLLYPEDYPVAFPPQCVDKRCVNDQAYKTYEQLHSPAGGCVYQDCSIQVGNLSADHAAQITVNAVNDCKVYNGSQCVSNCDPADGTFECVGGKDCVPNPTGAYPSKKACIQACGVTPPPPGPGGDTSTTMIVIGVVVGVVVLSAIIVGIVVAVKASAATKPSSK